MMKMKRDVNNNSTGSNGDTNSTTGAGRSFNDPFPRRSSSFSANPNPNPTPNQPSSAYLVYLLLVSVSCIVFIPYAGKITGGLGSIFRRVDEDDSSDPVAFAGAKSSSNYIYSNGNGNGRKTSKQFKGISSSRSRARSSSSNSNGHGHGHYTLLYEDGGAYDGLRGAYEAKCESLEVLVMDTQRVVHGERERTLYLENEIRVLQISENFLKGRVEYLEMMSRRRDNSGISKSMDPSSFSSMDPSSSSTTYNVFRNPSPSPSPSSSPPPPASSPSSSSFTASNGFTSRSDSLIQDLLKMVMAERDRTSALESEIRLLQSSESLMQARIQKLEEKLGTCKA